jgi:hypothetical protein
MGLYTPYLAVVRRRPGRAVLDPDTEVVIDGFPRTGNTFAVLAFQTAQPAPVRVAHHIHVAGHVVAAARRGLPTLVPVRPPEGAVVSVMMWWPHVGARMALAAYARFHERLLPWREACVPAPFDAVTSDLGPVVEALNRRFGTSFAPFAHTAENVERCYRLIEERSARLPWSPAISAYMSGRITAAQLERERDVAGPATAKAPEMRVARPSAARDATRERVRAAYLDPGLARLRERAERAYGRFVGD